MADTTALIATLPAAPVPPVSRQENTSAASAQEDGRQQRFSDALSSTDARDERAPKQRPQKAKQEDGGVAAVEAPAEPAQPSRAAKNAEGAQQVEEDVAQGEDIAPEITAPVANDNNDASASLQAFFQALANALQGTQDTQETAQAGAAQVPSVQQVLPAVQQVLTQFAELSKAQPQLITPALARAVEQLSATVDQLAAQPQAALPVAEVPEFGQALQDAAQLVQQLAPAPAKDVSAPQAKPVEAQVAAVPVPVVEQEPPAIKDLAAALQKLNALLSGQQQASAPAQTAEAITYAPPPAANIAPQHQAQAAKPQPNKTEISVQLAHTEIKPEKPLLEQAVTATANTGAQTESDSALSADSESAAKLSADAPDQPSDASVLQRSGGVQNTSFARVIAEAQPAPASPAEQMVAHVKAAVKNGDTRIQVQLNPVELGKLEIRLDVASDGKAKLSVTAENPRTLEMLRSDVRVLERMLTDVGFKADNSSMSFNLRDEGQAQQQASQNQQQGQQEKPYRGRTVDALDETLAQTAARAYTVADGLDIRI